MIFPDNYKFVGIKDREERGSKIYFSTQYLISRDGPSLYYVKSNGSGFMREVEELERIASGQQIAFCSQRVDTRNRTLLVDLAYEITSEGRANTVVFQGQDEHITFVKDPDPGQILAIEVMDVSPRPALADSCPARAGGVRSLGGPDGEVRAQDPEPEKVLLPFCLLPLQSRRPGKIFRLRPSDPRPAEDRRL